MESLLEEHERLVESANLSNSIQDVQNTIDILAEARDALRASKHTIAANFFHEIANDGHADSV